MNSLDIKNFVDPSISNRGFNRPVSQWLLRQDQDEVSVKPHNDEKWLSLNFSILIDALDIMQTHYYEVSHGTWPEAIDWTAAVMGTQVSATLAAISALSPLAISDTDVREVRDHENLVNRYFTQIAAFYFGENAFSLRTQAYDDMLWVVLGWLESIKFINLHSSLYYSDTSSGDNATQWYAQQFVPQFAHRARVFYDLASGGWDETLCGGGMIWNPYLAPYKNAITNHLFITASISMYLYFPGDNSSSPFHTYEIQIGDRAPAKAHHKHYLDNAVKGYNWLKESGMRNTDGLYVDGFHIKGWRGGKHASNGTQKCDLRDETVYTYNQGVLLSGLRGLWIATGTLDYLNDAHELIRNVITATGWERRDTPERWRWAGLGRNGVLEEACDWSGTCSQDGQTFKGIFFHHLSAFCEPLPLERGDSKRPWLGKGRAHNKHRQHCQDYTGWVDRNAAAALMTKDKRGEYGGWWGRSAKAWSEGEDLGKLQDAPTKGRDCRNYGVPNDDVWRLATADNLHEKDMRHGEWERIEREASTKSAMEKLDKDINDRGRGRTVETQSGGLAVLRAAWKLTHHAKRSRFTDGEVGIADDRQDG